MKVTILGSGSSTGVPAIGCRCKVCKSNNPKNKRTRASIHVEYKNTSVIIDTSPDLRYQALNVGLVKVDGIFYTHSHADHINGIDDVRAFNMTAKKALDAYGDKATLDYIKKAFPFVFWENVKGKGWYKPWLKDNYLEFDDEFIFGDFKVRCFKQMHGKMPIMGYRINDIAYTTDTNFIDEKGFEILEGVKLWVVDCLRYDHSDTHANYELAMEWIAKVKPQKAILTHMAHDIDYEEISKDLPEHIIAGYDGLSVIVS